MFQLASVPVLLDVVVILLRQITVLIPNSNFLVMPLLHAVINIIYHY